MHSYRPTAVPLGFILLSLALIAASCADKPARDSDEPSDLVESKTLDSDEPSDLVESKTMKAELDRLLAEVFKAAQDAGEPVPKGVDRNDLVARMIRETREYHPTFLRVRPDVERRWKEGNFADEAAKTRVNQAIQTLSDFKVALASMHKDLIEQHKAGALSGARLELAAQLFEAELAKFKEALGLK